MRALLHSFLQFMIGSFVSYQPALSASEVTELARRELEACGGQWREPISVNDGTPPYRSLYYLIVTAADQKPPGDFFIVDGDSGEILGHGCSSCPQGHVRISRRTWAEVDDG